MIATLGFAALCYFLIADAFYGTSGGALGALLQRGLRALVGTTGAILVLVTAAVAVTVWITNVSVKRVIGLAIVTFAKLRALAGNLRSKGVRPSDPAALPEQRPASLREAFNLPAILPKSKPSAASSPAMPVRAPTATTAAAASAEAGGALATIAPIDAPAGDETYDEVVEEFDEDELDDDDLDDDDEFDDEDDLDDDDANEVDDENPELLPQVVYVGEYQPAVAAAGIAAAATAVPVTAAGPERRSYRLPDLALFDPPQAQIVDESHRSHLLEDTLASFGVGAKVTHIERGPSITRYELKPERGVKISRISSLADDIALVLAATSVRIEAPIPGKSAVGIEVPNAQTSIVAISEILQAIPQRGTVPPLHMALGKDITGRPVFGDLGKMPHLLVAGATGSGKSVCLNGIIASLLVSATPDQVQMLFIDPKRVELTVYNGIPHLIKDVITDARLAAGALFEMTREMDGRYERFAKA
ncbi:MAG: hypothetical protein IAI49_15335, partial [Candidatus Eremiobacteraeota bacterium]|nr:hypothetical protein [Candidatus Eremiobacteraeota bacterium]